ncbi:WecB/TagA/CpsF family glycosyltransferase [Melittangium boletus]|uniref:Glycosyl transferase WecB/TagA/CpsF family n=1 Tax=Melittangium boletus DSM 14713 TaxID=1294270 RepID=A0A286SGG2_9BACT|nr:WecB/TagA/CpsF family glycosyltransferase [Melittangium boletus]ATB26629.1 glycosyl transferase WecB/TagA/CpsF family [Melittangium boletus DSM 14713]
MNGVMGLGPPKAGPLAPGAESEARSLPTSARRIFIGRVPVDSGRLEDVLGRVARLVESGQGGRVILPDVDHVVRAEREEALREALATAELSLAGSPALVRAAERLGSPLVEPRSGAQWLPPLAGLARERAWRVVVVSDRPNLSERAAGVLRDTHGLLAVGVAAPDMPGDGQGPGVERLIERIALTRPDLVWVSLATPTQELFCLRAAAQLPRAVLVGTGPALESLARSLPGSRRRNPWWAPVRWLRQRWAFLRVLASMAPLPAR